MAYGEGFQSTGLGQSDISASTVQGYILHGDAESLAALSPELILVAIQTKLGELGVAPAIEVTPIADLCALPEFREKPEPVYVNYESFERSHPGGVRLLARRTWKSLVETSLRANNSEDHYSSTPVRLNENGTQIDLRSVRNRLVASRLYPDAWVYDRYDEVGYLMGIVNQHIVGEEQLKWEDFGPLRPYRRQQRN